MDGYSYKISVDTNGNLVLPQLEKHARKADTSLNKLGKGSKASMGLLAKNVNHTAVSLNHLNKGAKEADDSIKKVGKGSTSGIKGVSDKVENVNEKLEKTNRKSKKVKNSVDDLGRSSGRSMGLFSRNVKRTNSGLSKMRNLVAGIGLTLSAGAIATGLVQIGAGYEKSMSNVQALSNATQAEMVSLRQSVRDAGATTEHTAQASGDAMGYLAMAGFKADQMIAALPGTLNLASSGSLSLARSADIATNVLSQYRMKASQTGIVVDQLAFTQSNFNTNIEEAADAMNYWGPTAAALNMTLSESNATIGLLANNGLKGSLGTRALATSIVRLTKPTKEMRSVQEKLNLSLFNGKGEFVGMAGMVEQLNSRMAGFTSQQKQSALASLFGAEAIQEVNILMAEGADKIRYWSDELEHSEGTAKRIASIKLDNLSGDFKTLQSSSQEFGIGLYEEVSPTLRLMTKEATLFIRSLDTKEIGLHMKKFVGLLYSGSKFLKDNWKFIVGIGKGYVALRVGMTAYNVSMRVGAGLARVYAGSQMLMQTGLRASTSAMFGFNTACNLNPIIATASLVVAGITAVASAMALFRDRTIESNKALSDLDDQKIRWKTRVTDVKDIDKDIRVDGLKMKDPSSLNSRQSLSLYERLKSRKEALEDKLLDNNVDEEYLRERYYGLIDQQNAIKSARKKRKPFATLPSGKKVKVSDYIDSLGAGTDKYRALSFTINKIAKQVNSNDDTESKIRDLMLKNSSMILKIKPFLPKEEVVKKPSDTVIPNAADMSSRVSGGGSSQKIFNITVPKFQDQTVFNLEGDKDDILNHVDELFYAFKANLARVLNSANQM